MRKRLSRWLLGTFILLTLLCLGLLWLTHFEITRHGVHTGLRVDLPGSDLRLRTYAGTGDAPRIPGFVDGPLVRTGADGQWQAQWFCEDKTASQQGRGTQLQFNCGGREYRYALAQPAPAADVQAEMPERLVVLSDIEGNLAFLDAALRKLEIVDAQGNWRFGRNQLLFNGDLVDRGRDAQAVLWRVHNLTLQAQAAGGQVHTLLGNHEQYDLRGNLSRAHPEHIYASRQLGGFTATYGADTVLGQWLRQQPVAVKLGKVLFAHGGISPAVAQSGLSVSALNQTMRDYWQAKPASTTGLDAVLGRQGVTQFRGYLPDETGKSLSPAELEQVLQAFGAERMVVAHTLVDKVEALYDGRVYAVDVNTNQAQPQVLVFEQGQPRVIDLGVPRGLPEDSPTLVRPFRVTSGEDWRAIKAMVDSLRTLSKLPHPY